MFVVGKTANDDLVVLPFENTVERDQLQLMIPFITDLVFQRISSTESSGSQGVAVGCADVCTDEIHVPLFVSFSDTAIIMKYWLALTSDQGRAVLTRLVASHCQKKRRPLDVFPFRTKTPLESAASPKSPLPSDAQVTEVFSPDVTRKRRDCVNFMFKGL